MLAKEQKQLQLQAICLIFSFPNFLLFFSKQAVGRVGWVLKPTDRAEEQGNPISLEFDCQLK